MKRFAVIGLGNFGFYVAKTLFEDGHDVIAIDKNRERVQEIEPFCSEAVVLDVTDKKRLKALGLEDVDAAVISTGAATSSSILLTLHLHEFGVKKILAKAIDEDHGKILEKVGASEIIYPEKAMAIRVARSLSTPNIMDFILLSEDYNLLQISPPQTFVGKSLKELDLRAKYNVHVIAIKEVVPENFLLVPPADFVIKDSDVLIMLGKAKDIKRIKDFK
ncbi:MAG: TrkA family potassium uptake protein [Deltaproteobacteria bacterium]|nr:TrkA family potassium uptake protein [Deltaproteobacteria bacterium]RLB95257.1 MAG: TrkA family potassium uptake protein [Deltaproteobacteria bacterium]RLC10606.1 MAG: TrkA family potassium uptake protein [Deltaproteobacteria bacterium]RLF30486.1 MAG: TrkA family potassium uptake protein [Thermoplasmata archaeon]